MQRTKTIFTSATIRYITAVLSVCLMLGVMIAGTHTKDVMGFTLGYGATASLGLEAIKKVEPGYNLDAQQKLTTDLHNHIDKQTLKTLAKPVGDDTNRASSREVQRSKKSRIRQLFDKEPESVGELFARALCLG